MPFLFPCTEKNVLITHFSLFQYFILDRNYFNWIIFVFPLIRKQWCIDQNYIFDVLQAFEKTRSESLTRRSVKFEERNVRGKFKLEWSCSTLTSDYAFLNHSLRRPNLSAHRFIENVNAKKWENESLMW